MKREDVITLPNKYNYLVLRYAISNGDLDLVRQKITDNIIRSPVPRSIEVCHYLVTRGINVKSEYSGRRNIDLDVESFLERL